MNDMAWTTLKGSPRMSSHPRPLSWIVIMVGALAFFLIYASWVLVSSPIGATVQGYFYSVGSSEKLDLPVSSVNEASINDGHSNTSLDLVDKNPSSEDLQSSTISTEVPSDSKTEQTDTTSNSQVDSGESTSVNLPMTKEVNSDTTVLNSGELGTLFGDRSDVANSSSPTQDNSQVDLNSKTTKPLVGTNSFNETGNIRMEEPTSVALINQSSAVTTASNETSISSGDSTSTAVPESAEKLNNTPSAGKLVQ